MSPSIDRKAFGQFIARHREQRGLTQAALAEAVGISRPYLAQIVGGKRLPSDDVTERLLILSGASMQDFMRDVLGSALTEDQHAALGALLTPWDSMSEQLTPEQMLALSRDFMSAEQMGAALGKLSGLEAQFGPEGWSELDKEDRRLVQRLINRLRKNAEGPTDGQEEGE
jgi:transcriptional regulator with XRE-family HTH domain